MSDTTAPDWLQDVKLVTFDCFGTLIDWRAGMEKVEVTTDQHFGEFEEACLELQQSDRHVAYSRVLKDVLHKMRPNLRRAIIGLFADDFGRMPSFPDAALALSSLKKLVRVGVLSNCDANHQLDVMSTLRVAWDVCITSQDLRAYKPTDRAWDTMVRMGVARTAVAPEQWLHVSAYERYDLLPARSRRLRTCHIRRPGGDTLANADLNITGLDELVTMLATAKEGPLLLEILNTTSGARRDELRGWLTSERINAIRAVVGVTDAQVIEDDDGTLTERYMFGGRGEYEHYVDAFSAEHKANLREAFGDDVQQTQRICRVRATA